STTAMLSTCHITAFVFHCVCFCGSGYPRVLHPFPTRRSSDLVGRVVGSAAGIRADAGGVVAQRPRHVALRPVRADQRGGPVAVRSEEHTSELQSQSNLVCRLLREKKKSIIWNNK